MTFCCYDKRKKYFTQMDKNCRNVDTAGKWQTFEFNYTPRPNNTAYLTKIAYVIPLFILDAGEFCLDDWSGKVKVPSAKIQLDD